MSVRGANEILHKGTLSSELFPFLSNTLLNLDARKSLNFYITASKNRGWGLTCFSIVRPSFRPKRIVSSNFPQELLVTAIRMCLIFDVQPQPLVSHLYNTPV